MFGKDGASALHMAVLQNSSALCEMLLCADANVHASSAVRRLRVGDPDNRESFDTHTHTYTNTPIYISEYHTHTHKHTHKQTNTHTHTHTHKHTHIYIIGVGERPVAMRNEKIAGVLKSSCFLPPSGWHYPASSRSNARLCCRVLCPACPRCRCCSLYGGAREFYLWVYCSFSIPSHLGMFGSLSLSHLCMHIHLYLLSPT